MSLMPMPKIAVIIVNWNTGELLADCVQSLLALPEKGLIHSIHVIDNASTDNSVEVLRHRISTTSQPVVHITLSKINLGFAKANNQAITAIGEQDVHLLLLNPDTRVIPGALAALAAVLAENSASGVVGPRLRNPNGSLQRSIRRFPTLAILILFFLKLGLSLPSLTWGRNYLALDVDYEHPQAVDQVMGAAFLIRNTVWQQIGPLDEKFWVWFEEVDYCRRVKNAGWAVVYTPSSEIIHYGGVSFNQLVGIRRTWLFTRSALRYARKHLGWLPTALLMALFPLTFILAVLTSTFRLLLRK